MDTHEHNSLCADPFWDSNLTWYTAIPDFTACFQQTILTAAPCIAFWFAAAVNIGLHWKHRRLVYALWTPLNITKLGLSSILLSVSFMQLGFSAYKGSMGQDSPDIDVYASSIKAVTYALVIIIMVRNRDLGKRSSTLLTLFWLSMTLCGIISFRSVILHVFHKEFPSVTADKYIPDMVYYPIVFLQFFLSLFPDKTIGVPLEEKGPVETAPIFSFLTFYWFYRYIFKGRKSLLTLDSLSPMPFKLESAYVWRDFEAKWASKLRKYISTGESSSRSNIAKPSLAWVIIKAFWPRFLLACVLQLVEIFVVLVSPLLLTCLMDFIKSDDYLWKGYMYCVGFFVADFIARLAFNFMAYYATWFSLQVRNSLYGAVYRKALILSCTSRRQCTTGEIVNFMAVDVEKIVYFCSTSEFLIGSPVKIIMAITFMWAYLGPSCLSGVAALFFVSFVTGFLSTKIQVLQGKQMELKDSRLKFITEIMNGIKVLKLYAWEVPYMKKVSDIREKEIGLIRTYQFYYAGLAFLFSNTTFLFAVASFVTYILVNENNILDPATVFVTLNLINLLKYAILNLPDLVTDTVQTAVSVGRVTKFLTLEEKNEENIGNSPDLDKVISIRDATLSWSKEEEPTLRNIDFHVEKGSLVAVIGPVGSGKSSLLSAVLGEMHKHSGTVDVKGNIAYVPQQAWILNQTVKDNIVFVNPMSRNKYNTVLEKCCLNPDLEILPAGDNTEIGEKGVNLSGGQKQRISLGRAVYHDADIYLLDDPLSAVDAHVMKDLFEHVIGRNGLLKNKSRVLVTHNVSVLSEADVIITMKDGQIIEKGTYEELMSHESFFAEFIKEYAQAKVDDGDGDKKMNAGFGAGAETVVNLKGLTDRCISVQSMESAASEDSKEVDAAGMLVEEENMEVGMVKREVFMAYAKYMGYGILLAAVLCFISNQAFEIGGNVWLSKWSSDPAPVNGTQDVPLRNLRIAVYSAIGTLQGITIVLGTVLLAIGETRAAKRFHENMLQSVIKAPMSFFDTTPVGRVLNRFSQDTDEIDVGMNQEIDGWLYFLFNVLGIIIVISVNSPLFIPFAIPLLVVYTLIQRLYLMTSRQMKRLSSTTRSPVYSHLTESIHGSSSINAYKVSEHFIQKAEEKMNTNCLCQFMMFCCRRWLFFNLSLIGEIIILVTATLAVVYKDNLGPAIVGLSVTYALSVTDSLNWLIRQGTELENKGVSVERVVEYSNLTPEAPWEVPETQPPDSWPDSGEIQFSHYSTRYRENLNLVLDDVDLRIKEREKVGVVGRTGAGKSSFALALFRIIEPASGTIEIDLVDVTEIGLHQLRKKLTIIPQDPVLFTGTLRHNLDPNDMHSDDEIWWSLEHANLKTFITSLPEGLSHDVAEGGSNLSVGQRQLVCLARALLKKAKVLVLDEATAAVDVETDALIQNTIRNEFKDHTVITIAHRLNTILDYDRVLVLDAGKIIEMGNPVHLMQNPTSKFHQLAKDAGLV